MQVRVSLKKQNVERRRERRDRRRESVKEKLTWSKSDVGVQWSNLIESCKGFL